MHPFIRAFIRRAGRRNQGAGDRRQTGPFKELIPQFERATGHKVVAEYAATPQVMKKIQEGAPFDVVVMIDTPMKDPANQQHFAAGPRPPFAASVSAPP